MEIVINHSSLFLVTNQFFLYCSVDDLAVTAELLYGLRKEMESGRLPSNIAARMEEVYHNYRNAVSNDITHVDDVGINHQHFLTMPFYVFFPCQIFKFGYRVSAR